MQTFRVHVPLYADPVEVTADKFGVTETGALIFQSTFFPTTEAVAAFAPGTWERVLTVEPAEKEAAKVA